MHKLGKIFYGISLISMILFFILLYILNVIPIKFLLIFCIISCLIYIILGIVLFKIKKKIILIFLLLLETLFTVIFLYTSYSVYKTNHFLNHVENKKEEVFYHMIVLKENKYNKLEDVKNKKIATYSLNDENYSIALNNVKEKISFQEIGYQNFSLLPSTLFLKQVDAIFISDFNKEMLEEEIEEFSDKTKIIYTEKIELKKEEQQEEQEYVNEKTFNILISGMDAYGSIYKVSRSDVNIIATINPKSNEILLTSIPRDYYVKVHNTTGLKDKLTHTSIYGMDTLVKTVEDLLQIDISYYIRVNFDTLVNVVNKIGGIDVYSDASFTAYNTDTFVKGWNHLNGRKALAYCRERKIFLEGDRKRGEHQKQVIEAIIKKVSNSRILLTSYLSILDSLENTFQTSVPSSVTKAFVKEQLKDMKSWNVKSIALNGTNGMDYTYSMPGYLLYVMIPDQKTIDYAKQEINKMQ